MFLTGDVTHFLARDLSKNTRALWIKLSKPVPKAHARASTTLLGACAGPTHAEVPCPAECPWSCVESRCDPVVEVVSGALHACARTESRRVHCWGGQAGAYVGAPSLTPVRIEGLMAARLAAGETHTCALPSGLDPVVCWGSNEHGQLGDSTNIAHADPRPVGTRGDAFGLTAGGSTTCVVELTSARCWGAGGDGQLGRGATDDVLWPSGLLPREVRLGARHGCAALETGVECWGSGIWGQLGDGSLVHEDCRGVTTPVSCATAPVAATALGSRTRVFVGADVTCTLDGEGRARCLGWNGHGQLGDGALAHELCGLDDCSRTLVDVVLPSGIDSIASVAGATCFLVDGHVWCAGAADLGLLGDGAVAHGACPAGAHSDGDCATTPVEVSGLDDATALFGGSAFYAVRASGGLVAWGPNSAGGLGDGSTETRDVPTAVRRP